MHASRLGILAWTTWMLGAGAWGCGGGGDNNPVADAGMQGVAGRSPGAGGASGANGAGGMAAGNPGADAGGPLAPTHFNAPPVAPIVRAATPGALRPTAALRVLGAMKAMFAMLAPVGSARAQAAPTDVTASITALFKDMYTKISGGQTQGLINSSLEDLDSRMAFVDKVPSTSACQSATPKAHRIDLSSFGSALDLTLHLQCSADTLMAFGRDDTGWSSDADGGIDPDVDGGGVGSGSAYSLWLHLNYFGYFANVFGVGTGDESVDFLFVENSPPPTTTNPVRRIGAYRVKAQPSTNRFELVYGATDGGGTAGENLRCGFKMISDGKYIWAVGKDHLFPAQACADAARFTRCLSATDLSEQPTDTPCAKLKTEFTMAAPTAEALASAGSAITAVLPVETASSETTPF